MIRTGIRRRNIVHPEGPRPLRVGAIDDRMSQRGRLQRITMPSRSDLRRAEVSLRSSGELPPAVILQAAEQLCRVMAAPSVTDIRITVCPDSERPES